MSDGEQIGVWRLESIESAGRAISGGLTYLVVRSDFLFEVSPGQDAAIKASPVRGYELRVEGDALVLVVAHERRGALFARVTFDGERMRCRWGAPDGELPAADDPRGALETYVRETSAATARAISAAGPSEPPVRLRHPALGAIEHDPDAGIWNGGRLREADLDVAVEIEAPRTASPADLDRALYVLRRAPMDQLASLASAELAWLDRHTSDELVADDAPSDPDSPDALEPLSVRIRADRGLSILFEGGLLLDVDAAYELEEASYADVASPPPPADPPDE